MAGDDGRNVDGEDRVGEAELTTGGESATGSSCSHLLEVDPASLASLREKEFDL